MPASNIKLKDNSVDLVLFVRVMHHLPDPRRELDEIARILKPGGLAIIEVANYMHAQNRFKHLVKAQKFSAERLISARLSTVLTRKYHSLTIIRIPSSGNLRQPA